MLHMHFLKVYHRDLKPGNLMIDGNGNLKVGDFGATVEDLKAMGTQTGHYSDYFADADARTNNFKPPSDVYAFGLCMHTIMYGNDLYHEGNRLAYEQNIGKSDANM